MINFSDDIKNRAFIRSGFKCECTGLSCDHIQRCGKALYRGSWHAAAKIPAAAGGDATVENCEIICASCHEKHQLHHEHHYSGSQVDY